MDKESNQGNKDLLEKILFNLISTNNYKELVEFFQKYPNFYPNILNSDKRTPLIGILYLN